jgi:hypothetical protein
MHKKKGKLAGVTSHRAKERQASSKAKGRRRCRSVATTVGRAALRCDRGAAPKGAGDENLRHGRLHEHQLKHQRERKGEEGKFFTGGERYQ